MATYHPLVSASFHPSVGPHPSLANHNFPVLSLNQVNSYFSATYSITERERWQMNRKTKWKRRQMMIIVIYKDIVYRKNFARQTMPCIHPCPFIRLLAYRWLCFLPVCLLPACRSEFLLVAACLCVNDTTSVRNSCGKDCDTTKLILS